MRSFTESDHRRKSRLSGEDEFALQHTEEKTGNLTKHLGKWVWGHEGIRVIEIFESVFSIKS